MVLVTLIFVSVMIVQLVLQQSALFWRLTSPQRHQQLQQLQVQPLILPSTVVISEMEGHVSVIPGNVSGKVERLVVSTSRYKKQSY